MRLTAFLLALISTVCGQSLLTTLRNGTINGEPYEDGFVVVSGDPWISCNISAYVLYTDTDLPLLSSHFRLELAGLTRGYLVSSSHFILYRMDCVYLQ